MRQCKIHIIAAYEQMISHCRALQREFTAFFGDFNKSQIGRAAADVADQHAVADFE